MNIKVGDQFRLIQDAPYVGPSGRGIHHTEILVQVTEADEWGCSWALVEVLSETGAPQTGARPAPKSGGFAVGSAEHLAEVGIYKA
jgi:hypothetical protein